MLCIDSCGAPTSTVRIPTPLAKMGPIVEPQGMSFRTTKSYKYRKLSLHFYHKKIVDTFRKLFTRIVYEEWQRPHVLVISNNIHYITCGIRGLIVQTLLSMMITYIDSNPITSVIFQLIILGLYFFYMIHVRIGVLLGCPNYVRYFRLLFFV